MAGAEFGVEPASKALALLVLRNSPQKRHLIARDWMASAQKGHCFVFGWSNVTISIKIYIGNMPRISLNIIFAGSGQ
jgi:hypothetical protein